MTRDRLWVRFPSRKLNIIYFHFLRSGVGAKRVVAFRHLTRNATGIVLILGSLCLPCCVRCKKNLRLERAVYKYGPICTNVVYVSFSVARCPVPNLAGYPDF